MRNLTISRVLIIFGVIVSCGLAASIGLQTLAFEELKVGGPKFNEISDGKDLVADILPPPLYVVETYMLANEAAIHPELTEANLAKITALKAAYDDRRAFWKNSMLPQNLRDKLENDVMRTGDVFWGKFESTYLPAVKSQDKGALITALGNLKDSFYAHDAQVRQLADMANTTLANSVASADQASASYQMIAFSGSGASVLLFIGGLWFLRRRAIKPIIRISDYMSVLVTGDYSHEVPLTSRGDEIGSMAKSVDVFRKAGIERQQIRHDLEQSRLKADADRQEQELSRIKEAHELSVVVEALGAGLGRLAECNIRFTIDEPFADRFDSLRIDFNNSLATFQATLEEVLGKTAQLSGSAQEMDQAADNLYKRTEQQAAALEHTSASLEEVASTIRTSVERTGETRTLVRAARECATSSSKVVREAVDAMKRIEGSSTQISQIIHVIDEIAFQTNLLALNAGVEAARAGEAGKGFAVVAQEVRELAQRSANAAKDITNLIRTSSSEVATGVRLVDETGEALDRISGFVSDIDAKVDAIATASKEQATSLQEITSAVTALDQMTQQNAAMVEETTAISSTLATDAGMLTQLVQRFKLNRRGKVRELDAQSAQRRVA